MFTNLFFQYFEIQLESVLNAEKQDQEQNTASIQY